MRKKRRKKERMLAGLLLALICIAAVVLVVLLVDGIRAGGKKESESTKVQTESAADVEAVHGVEETLDSKSIEETETADSKSIEENSGDAEEDAQEETAHEKWTIKKRKIYKLLTKMSLEEKVAQLFMVTPEVLTGYSQVTMAGEATRQAYEAMPVGGIILMSSNLTTPDAMKEMTANLHAYSEERIGAPVLIGIDEEGGTVLRIGSHGNFDVPYIGDMSEVGAGGNTQDAYDVGVILGQYLNEYGIDVDFAPVADVWWNSENTVVEKRSFGSDASLVADMVSREVEAMQAQGVAATLKHFPGHGGTSGDSHAGFVTVWESMEEMQANDLIPFQAGIDAGAQLVMAGHVCTPGVTDESTPATLSSYWLTDVLRGEMGFEGVIITDALNMGAISQNYNSTEACIQALEAGVDMLLMPDDFYSDYQGVLQAVQEGRLTEERIDGSLSRILDLKIQE